MNKKEIREIFLKQKNHCLSVGKSSAIVRTQKLKKLKEILLSRTQDLQKAIFLDYKKSPVEVDISEVYSTVAEIDFAIKNLKKWMKPIRVGNPLLMFGSRSELHYESKGVVLIIGPWNYPCSLVLIPLVAAIAAGNCAVLKPSELTENTSRFLSDLVRQCFQEEEVTVIQGDLFITQELLAMPFDHVFFTGSTRVGRLIMEAAAKHLTPVTLELGGKSPVIVDDTAPISEAALRIVWGKFFNAGQTCIAPDYVLVSEGRTEEFLIASKKAISLLYGATEEEREKSPDFCRIINDSNYRRLKALCQEAVQEGSKIETGGRFNDPERYVSPTLISQVKPEHAIMNDEIFGPILPILSFSSLDEAYLLIRNQPKPLALYIFSQSRSRISEILKNTRAGGTCINNTLVHIANPSLPFGGTGQSGIGSYHGHFGYKTFSHERAIHRQGLFDSIRHLYPPYRRKQQKWVDLSIRFLTG